MYPPSTTLICEPVSAELTLSAITLVSSIASLPVPFASVM